MRYLWLGIITVSAVPLLFVGVLLNPLLLLLLGVEWWREWLSRLYPWRWWIVFSGFVFLFSAGVYTIRYG